MSVVGVGKVFGADVPEEVKEEIIKGLRSNFEGECSEVGMYLAMARVAYREGYPEIGMYWEKAGLEEAEHAAKFAELLGEVVTDSTKKNLQMRVDAENGATPRTAPPPARRILPSSARSTTSTPCTTPSMRWPATRPATAKPSRACWSATSSEQEKAQTL